MLDQLSRRSSFTHQPRVSEMPRCADCLDRMTAPEGSALLADGAVTYLWSCDRCGKTLITECFRFVARPSH